MMIMRRVLIAIFLSIIVVMTQVVVVSPQSDDTDSIKIVFDYSHGQPERDRAQHVDSDNNLAGNLTELGYDVVFATGGLNSNILEDATGLVIAYIWGGDASGYLENEIQAISDWYNGGHRFVWVGSNGDYDDGFLRIWANTTWILETIGSHLYVEHTECDDEVMNCGASYRIIANVMSENAFVQDCLRNVTTVYFHGPTIVYASNSSNPSHNTDAIALEEDTIPGVYPLVYYSPTAEINDRENGILPIVHENGEQGSFVGAAMEIAAGVSETNVLVVSGASPYADRSMAREEYYDVSLDGYLFVRQTIDFGIQLVLQDEQPVMVYIVAGIIITSVVILAYIFGKEAAEIEV